MIMIMIMIMRLSYACAQIAAGRGVPVHVSGGRGVWRPGCLVAGVALWRPAPAAGGAAPAQNSSAPPAPATIRNYFKSSNPPHEGRAWCRNAIPPGAA